MSVYSWTNRDKEEKKADSTPTQLAVLMFSRRNASTLFHCCVFFGASLFLKKKHLLLFFPCSIWIQRHFVWRVLKLSTVSSFNHCFNSVSASRKDVAKNCICHCATLSERNPLDCVQRLKLDRRKIHAKPLNPFDCHYELFHVFYLIASGKKGCNNYNIPMRCRDKVREWEKRQCDFSFGSFGFIMCNNVYISLKIHLIEIKYSPAMLSATMLAENTGIFEPCFHSNTNGNEW